MTAYERAEQTVRVLNSWGDLNLSDGIFSKSPQIEARITREIELAILRHVEEFRNKLFEEQGKN